MIPYYFDIPELELPTALAEVPYRQHPSDFMSPSGLGMGGTTFQYRAVPSNWHSIIKAHLDSKVNLSFGALTLLNTNKDGSSPWHAEGPNLFGRQCALNFCIQGDIEKSYVQWCDRGEEDIRTNDTRGAWWEDDKLNVLAEHRMVENRATIYNTMHWHRVFNFTDVNRVVVSAAINTPIEEVYEKYMAGELINE